MNNQVDIRNGLRPGAGQGRPTMRDVASRAGVALKTVSRVVNGEPGVTPETARRVLGAIEELGFRRNESARLLRTGRTATIGFIADTWAEPDYPAVYRAVEDVARGRGYLLYSGSTDHDPAREERLALAMCARRVDGLVIIPTRGSHDYLVSEIEAGVRTVFVLRPPALVRADAVLPDERAGGRLATAHLISQGHRRIALVGDPGWLAGPPAPAPVPRPDGIPRQDGRASAPDGRRSGQLLAGYADAMAAAGLTPDPAWTSLSAERLPHAPVTAVVCASPGHTEAALRALARHGRRMAVVGFGDVALADLMSPGLTTVSYDPGLIGRTAGDLLIRRLAGELTPPRTVHVPVRLVTRGSAEFPPDAG